MKAVVVIPTFNEKENIEKLLNKLLQVFKKIRKWKLQVLVVDDNSPDGTAKVVENFKKNHKNVHLLVRQKKVGLGAAYIAGMDYAVDILQAQVVLVMDADLSHDPKYIPRFLDKIEERADFVIGSRYIRGGSIPREWAMHRKIYSVLGNKTVTLFLGFNQINDWTSGFRAMKKEVYEKVKKHIRGQVVAGYTFNMSFAYHVLLFNFKTAQVPIVFPDRKAGKSKLGMEYLFYTPIFLVKTRLGL